VPVAARDYDFDTPNRAADSMVIFHGSFKRGERQQSAFS